MEGGPFDGADVNEAAGELTRARCSHGNSRGGLSYGWMREMLHIFIACDEAFKRTGLPNKRTAPSDIRMWSSPFYGSRTNVM